MAPTQEQFNVDANSKKTAVVLSLKPNQKLIDNLHGLVIVAERRREEFLAGCWKLNSKVAMEPFWSTARRGGPFWIGRKMRNPWPVVLQRIQSGVSSAPADLPPHSKMESHIMKKVAVSGLSVALFLLLTSLVSSKGAKLSPEELVAKHLQSIGSPEALAALKACAVEGNGELRVLSGGSTYLHGPLSFLSSGDRLRYDLKFAYNPPYPAEAFSFDGKEVDIGYIQPGRRSPLGNFLYQHPVIISEGLVGGVLSTAWPLKHLQQREAKLEVLGLKKLGQQEVYEVRYHPKKRTDLVITLFFDATTFRHVKTLYELTFAAGLAPETPGRLGAGPNRYRLEEFFDNFQTVDGLTLPMHWRMQYTIDRRISSVTQWDMKIQKVKLNPSIEPGEFVVK